MNGGYIVSFQYEMGSLIVKDGRDEAITLKHLYKL